MTSYRPEARYSSRWRTGTRRPAWRWPAGSCSWGFRLAATSGTAAYFEADGVPVGTMVAKVSAPRRGRRRTAPAAEPASQGSTPSPASGRQGGPGRQHPSRPGPRADGAYIRRAANQHRVACLTTVAAARAAAAGIADRAASPYRCAACRSTTNRSSCHCHDRRLARRRQAATGRDVDLRPGSATVRLANPIMTASGTSGHGAELAAFIDLAGLGAVVVKSVSRRALGWQPGAPAASRRRRACSTASACRTPAWRWLAESSRPGRYRGDGRGQHLGFTADAVRRAAAALRGPGAQPGRCDRRGGSGRGQHLLPEHRRPPADVRPQPRGGPSGGIGRGEGLAGALPLWVKLSPNVTDLPGLAATAVRRGPTRSH